jgi:hypothetical protein
MLSITELNCDSKKEMLLINTAWLRIKSTDHVFLFDLLKYSKKNKSIRTKPNKQINQF